MDSIQLSTMDSTDDREVDSIHHSNVRDMYNTVNSGRFEGIYLQYILDICWGRFQGVQPAQEPPNKKE